MRDHLGPATLELLQVRMMSLRDTFDETLLLIHREYEGHVFAAEDSPGLEAGPEMQVSLSFEESLARLVNDDIERVRYQEGLDWYGPAESLSVQAAGLVVELYEWGDPLLTELEGHESHVSACRCPALRRLVEEHITPCFEEAGSLIDAVERYREDHPRLV